MVAFLRRRGRVVFAAFFVVVLAGSAGASAWRFSSSRSNSGNAAADEAAARTDSGAAVSVARGFHVSSVHFAVPRTSTTRPARPPAGEGKDEQEPVTPKLKQGPARHIVTHYVAPVRVAPTVRTATHTAASAA